MKNLRFLPIILAVVLSACTERIVDETPYGQDAEALLKVGLSVDDGQQEVLSKAGELDPDLVPPADSLWVELYRFAKKNNKAQRETWNRVYISKYEDARDTVLRVKAGKWKLLSFYGDSTACGFDKPYFLAEKEFDVDGGLKANGDPNLTVVEAQAKVSNVRITVNFDETVSGSYYDYFVRLARIDTSSAAGNQANKKYRQILRYRMDEERDAYMMATDSLQIQFMAQYEYGDESSWKFATLDTIATLPNDHVTIDVLVKDPRKGNLDVTIKTDDNIIRTDHNLEILEEWAPQDPPQVVASGFDANGDHAVVEGDNTGNNATISVIARAGLRNLYVKVDSDYLNKPVSEGGAGLDIPLGEELDLLDVSSSNLAKLDRLAAAGFDWQRAVGENGNSVMDGSRKLTYVTMTKLFEYINELNPSLPKKRDLAVFTIRAVDNVPEPQETVLELTATAYPITQNLSIPEGRVWARKIVSPELAVGKGLARLFVLQASTDNGVTWNDFATFRSADNSVIDYGTLAVEPSTTYKFRTVYNNNPNLVSNVVTVTTEDVLQVGNPGFEEYQTTYMHVEPMGSIGNLYEYDREWYLPYYASDADPWWAVNSRMTMPDGHTAWTSNFCKNFPCTAFSTNSYSGTKSAMVYTVNVGNTNTDGTAVGKNVPGEIWIGKADDSGNHTVDGHEFGSRPTSMKFWYKYIPNGNETFAVYVVLKDASGKEIMRTEMLDGGMAAEWTQCEIPMVYSDMESKASNLYICFKSCVSGGVEPARTMEIGGKQQTAHIGSVLKIDDIELTY